MNEGTSVMYDNVFGLCRFLLGATGVNTILVGATAPTEDIWPKLVAILGGFIATMFAVLFGGFLKHVTNHDKNIDIKIDDELRKQAHVCSIEMKEVIRETLKEASKNNNNLENKK